VKATAVFRERARGVVENGAPARAGDTVAVDAATAVRALLEHAAARSAAKDFEGARAAARMAVARAQTRDVPSDQQRRALFRLASLEHRLGNDRDAARLLQDAVDAFDVSPAAAPAERAEVLNELGVVQIEGRDLDAAARSLERARSEATGVTLLRATNNLGALAAIRGDRVAADRDYRAAAALAAAAAELQPERQAVETNLAALRRAR
jgi:tetratricopeptide (TPR) repeat protein